MAKKKKPKYDPAWAKAKKLCQLNMEDIRMAKELGMSPHSLMKNIPSASQQWKQPVKFWIRELYEKMRRKQAKKLKAASPEQAQQTAAAEIDPVEPPPGPEASLDHIPF